MRFGKLLFAPVLGLGLALVASPASAAPGGGALGGIKADAAAGSAVEKAGWHYRCHWRHGRRICHRYWVRPHVYIQPYAFYGPRIYIGPRRHHGYYGYRHYRRH